MEDHVRLGAVERAIGLVGEACPSVNQSRLQDNIAGLENLVIWYSVYPVLAGVQQRSAGDERAQRFCFVFDLVETVLDHIADTHDTAETSVPDHRKVTDAAVGHFGHQFV